MKRIYTYLTILFLLFLGTSTNAQERRPIDSQHPLWFIHIDVWNSADPQKIIDLIPADIKPYVCMNLSLSCQYDTKTKMYRMPRNAVRTYKSWASVCQLNDMWFTCQPASGGHTHIQDDDLETFEYFFKTYPNFLGWNYAEQFWGFDEGGDESSSTQTSRLALFAKLVPMHHQYGGFLTISFCGNIWSHGLNPIGMMKRNKDLLQACKDYPEACLWLYKYTTSSCFYNNESVTFGPFISGLAKNYGVRYDNCGWNGALDAILGEGHGKKYPGAAGIGTVMEQTCVNGGAVWDGPELIWTEDFQNLSNSTVNGYTRRNWGMFPNFKGIWLDMFRQIINGTMYIPTREEVVAKTKIVVLNDKSSGSDEDKYATWGSLYDGLYKQDDPFNRGNGQWMDNFCYFKKTGRYGTIPMVIALYDDAAKTIPVQVKKSNYTSRWATIDKKTADFDAQYPEVSTGDLYVNRYKNQLVTYTPYSYLNKKQTAQAAIPLQYNSCDTLKLVYGKLSSGLIREYADHIDCYLNNYRSDSTAAQTDQLIVMGVATKPTYTKTNHSTGATGYSVSVTEAYDASARTYTLTVKHMGPVDIKIECTGTNTRDYKEVLPSAPLPKPLSPSESNHSPLPARGAGGEAIIIEAENMDYKNIGSVDLTHSGWWATDMQEFAGMGYVKMGTSTSGSLRHQLNLSAAGDYDILVRYCNSSKAGNLKVSVNGTAQNMAIEKVAKNDWHKAKVSASLNAGSNTLILTNTAGINMIIDQLIYMPANAPQEKFKVTIREVEHLQITADCDSAVEGQTVKLTIVPEAGYELKELRMVNSIFYTMGKTIAFTAGEQETTFVMPDDNITIQPTVTDASSLYKLDFTSVLNGTLPEGWQSADGTDIHSYPNSYGSGSRTFAGFTGYQGKGLYWRNTNAEYGRQAAYPLALVPGEYKLTFAMAAWKGSPQYKAHILSDKNATIAASQAYTATPNANGSTSANLSAAALCELPFEVKEQGNYIISFIDNGTGFDEFLLLDCRLNAVVPSGIATVAERPVRQPGIYSPSGMVRRQLQRGLNIIVSDDGRVRKVIVR